MYVLLTGDLPYTVLPFSVKGLISKILNEDINEIKDDLSIGDVFLSVIQNEYQKIHY